MSPSSSSGGSIPLHHCKFVDYTPSSVTAIAFPPIPLPTRRRPNATASSTSGVEPEMGIMAVGKGNGDVEIFRWVERSEGGQGWVLYRCLISPNGTKIESLVFTLKQSFLRSTSSSPSSKRIASLADVRLFSSGRSSDLVEWDLKSGCILRLLPTQSGSLWSLAPNPSSTLLALGCEDGSLRLVSLLDDSDLTHLRRFDRTKTRLLSIAWGPPTLRPTPASKATTSESDSDDDEDEDEEEWNDSWLVTGCSDSCLRKWDFKSGRVVERMVVEKEKLSKKGPKGNAGGGRTIVWCVGVLKDGSVVSGDSMGNVKIWDSNTGTQISSFHAHGADVLCLAVSPDHQSIFTSGIDQKTVQFSLVHVPSSLPSSTKSSSTIPKWIQSTSRRLHTHDVLSLAIFPPSSPVPSAITSTAWPTAPILVSGGVDTSIVMTPCSTPGSRNDGLPNPLAPLSNSTSSTILGEAYYRKMGGLNGVDAATISVSKSEDSRLVVCRREGGLGVWRVAGKEASVGKGAVGGWEKVLEMELKKSTTGMVCSAVSADGKWLAVSDLGETKLFGLETLSNGSITPHRIRSFTSTLVSSCPSLSLALAGTGSSSVTFSPDSSKLILATFLRGDVIVVDLSSFYEDDDEELDEDEQDAPEIKVLRVFEQTSAGGRVVVGTGKHAEAAASATEGDMEVDEVIGGGGAKVVERATVVCMAVGHDGQWLAVADLLGRTRVYNLDTLQLHSHLPTFPSSPPSSLAFLPNPSNPTTSLLLISIPSGNQLHIYSVEARRFPPNLTFAVPESVRSLPDPVVGLAVDASSPSGKGNVLMWGATWILRVKLNPSTGSTGKAGGRQKKKRSRAGEEVVAVVAPVVLNGAGGTEEEQKTAQQLKSQEQERFKLTQTFRPMLGLDYVGKGELVVVERPWLDLVAGLPGGFFRGGKYGT